MLPRIPHVRHQFMFIFLMRLFYMVLLRLWLKVCISYVTSLNSETVGLFQTLSRSTAALFSPLPSFTPVCQDNCCHRHWWKSRSVQESSSYSGHWSPKWGHPAVFPGEITPESVFMCKRLCNNSEIFFTRTTK